MLRLQITTKIGCTIACSYCPQDRFIKAYRKRSSNLSMSLDSFRTYIEGLPPEVAIWFAGMSEPWLNAECTEMLLYAHKRGHKISVFTTLTGMKSSDIDLLESVPFDFFRIHVPSDSGHENIRINDNYLNVMDRISESKINTSFHCHGRNTNVKVKALLDSKKKAIEWVFTLERSGNLRIKGRLNLPRRRGIIGCGRNLNNNVLLPNGDVILCSNDYGMKHILGNIVSSGYDSLFNGNEFIKIRKGQQDESIDTLCRYCQDFCGNVNLFAKVYNIPYRLNKNIIKLRARFKI